MMIHHVVARFWTQHDRDHVFAEKFSTLFTSNFAPMFALGFDFAHSDGDLRRSKIGDCDTRQRELAHHFALLKQCVVTTVIGVLGSASRSVAMLEGAMCGRGGSHGVLRTALRLGVVVVLVAVAAANVRGEERPAAVCETVSAYGSLRLPFRFVVV